MGLSLGKDPEDVMIDNIGPGGGSAVYHMMIESDVEAFMVHPQLMVGSDGPTPSHPRGSSTFPRFWGHYARDLGMFAKREAVRKTSTLAAEQFRLLEQHRGALRAGYYADITLLDYAAVIDAATFDAPTLPPVGMEYVLINGAMVVNEGVYQPRYSGRVLRLTDSTSVPGWRLY